MSKEKFSRRDFLKIAILGAGGLALAADSRVSRLIQAGEVKTTDIPLLRKNFGESILLGDITKMEESLPGWQPLISRASAAISESKYANWISANRYGIWGRALIDSHKNIEPLIFTCILNAEGAALAPTPEKRRSSFLKNPPSVFFYTESDGRGTFVPPGQGEEQAGGLMIPMKAWTDGKSYNVGIPTEVGDAYLPIPVFRFNLDNEGNIISSLYIHPYSDQSVAINDKMIPFSSDLEKNLFLLT